MRYLKLTNRLNTLGLAFLIPMAVLTPFVGLVALARPL
jgi:hypothetical protein